MKKFNPRPFANALLSVCLVFLITTYGCKKRDELLPNQLKAVSTTKPIGSLANEHYKQLTQNLAYRSVLDDLTSIGYVDWGKMVVDICGDDSKPYAYVFPVYGSEAANDLLVFQYSGDQRLSGIHLLHYDTINLHSDVDGENVKRRLFYVLGKQGVKTPTEITTAIDRAYLKSSRSVQRPDVVKKIDDIRLSASKKKIGQDTSALQPLSLTTSSAPTCMYIGQWHWTIVLNTWNNDQYYLGAFRAAFIEDMINFSSHFYGIFMMLNLGDQNFTADVSSLVSDSSIGAVLGVEAYFTSMFHDMVPRTSAATNIAATLYGITFYGYLSCYGGVVIDVPPTDPTDPPTNPPGDGGDPNNPNPDPMIECVQEASAYAAALLDDYAQELPSAEQVSGAMEVSETGATQTKVESWEICHGLTWAVKAKTKMTVSYPLPLHPDKYLRNKILSVEHDTSFYEGTNVMFISTWTEMSHIENVYYNNTPHPEGDAYVSGMIVHKFRSGQKAKKNTKCGEIEADRPPLDGVEKHNILHILI